MVRRVRFGVAGCLRSAGASGRGQLAAGPAQTEEAQPVPADKAQIQLSFAPLVRKVAPAVVNIYTQRVVRRGRSRRLFNDPFFRQFFGDDFQVGAAAAGAELARLRRHRPPRRPHRHQRPRHRGRAGNHGGARRPARVRGDRDLTTSAPTSRCCASIRAAQAADPRVRDDSDTRGRRSRARHRQPVRRRPDGDQRHRLGARAHAVGITDYGFFIQTDAAINPGNSGGALVVDRRAPGRHQYRDLLAAAAPSASASRSRPHGRTVIAGGAARAASSCGPGSARPANVTAELAGLARPDASRRRRDQRDLSGRAGRARRP